jgi:hypothetical protein
MSMHAYLKRYNRSSMVFDDTEPVFDKSHFQKCDWSEYFPGACEAVLPDAPKVRGQSVLMSLLTLTMLVVASLVALILES